MYQVRQMLPKELLQQRLPGGRLGGEAPEVLHQGSQQEGDQGRLQGPICGRNEAF